MRYEAARTALPQEEIDCVLCFVTQNSAEPYRYRKRVINDLQFYKTISLQLSHIFAATLTITAKKFLQIMRRNDS